MATDWVKVSNPDGKPYFWNTKTDETSWDKPVLRLGRAKHKSELPTKAASNENNGDEDNSVDIGKRERTESKARSVSAPTWQKVQGDDGDVYWWNVETNETRWQLPAPPKKPGKTEEKPEKKTEEKPEKKTEEKPEKKPEEKDGLDSVVVGTRWRRCSAAPKLTQDRNPNPIEPPVHHARSASSVAGDGDGHGLGLLSPKASPTSKSRRHRLFGGHRNSHEQGSKAGEDWAERLKQMWKEKGGSGKYKHKHGHKGKESGEGLGLEIGEPYQVEHVAHVSFDAREAKFRGLPSEWEGLGAQEQFGGSLGGCPRVAVPGFGARIPAVLVFLRKSLEELGGLRAEGLFRVAPDGAECRAVRAQLGKGLGAEALRASRDPHLWATLIKQFYRELRPNLLNPLSRDQILHMSEYTLDDQFQEGILHLPEPNRSAFLWLLDLMASVAQYESVNKMSPKNLAIVISPNLYDAHDQPPMEALVLSQKTANLVTKFLLWQINRKKKSAAEEDNQNGIIDGETDNDSDCCDHSLNPPHSSSSPLPPAPPVQK